MARVYLGEVWNGPDQPTKVTGFKGTIEWVSMIGGSILPETGEDVPDTLIDGQGRCPARPASQQEGRPGWWNALLDKQALFPSSG